MNRLNVFCLTAFAVACAGLVVFQQAQAQPGQATAKAVPPPDVRDAPYGPHARNVLDLWQAKADKPTPLVIYIHGGGFRGGDKSSIAPALLTRCLDAGISVAAINYRLSQQAPYPAPMLDGARAVQFLRSKADEWHLDPKRFAATGSSAGAGIALWIGFHDNWADPQSNAPVARQSTRLTCMAVQGAQASYDPRWIQKVVGGRAHEHPALPQLYGLKPEELDTPRAHQLYEAASPITYVSADDPPVFLFYSEPKEPLPPDAPPGQGIHHPRFGKALKDKLDALQVECVLRHRDDYKDKGQPATALHAEMVAFFQKHFGDRKAAGEPPEPKDRPKGNPAAGRRPGARPGEIITPAARSERLADQLEVGELAPDFTLPDLTGQKQVTLSLLCANKPVVLVFASYT